LTPSFVFIKDLNELFHDDTMMKVTFLDFIRIWINLVNHDTRRVPSLVFHKLQFW
ncbi:hypothetical protein HN51_068031, partial [Arachis hypogaea]